MTSVRSSKARSAGKSDSAFRHVRSWKPGLLAGLLFGRNLRAWFDTRHLAKHLIKLRLAIIRFQIASRLLKLHALFKIN